MDLNAEAQSVGLLIHERMIRYKDYLATISKGLGQQCHLPSTGLFS